MRNAHGTVIPPPEPLNLREQDNRQNRCALVQRLSDAVTTLPVAVTMIFLGAGIRGQIIWIAALLTGYWVLMTVGPWLGCS